ncbi:MULTISPECIES: restriction endonuclease [Enterobacteriaceae]|uniref:restriction endonuclease n=1 Tax=Enterobacteriaceae TaxID=543 RepID=UPI001F29F92E|nr:restriction endonuclease [Escherichia coli]MCF2001567.1 restriction endonuclease [Escherichia coli]
MGSCAAPSAKGDDKFITTDYLQQCQINYLRKIDPFVFEELLLEGFEAHGFRTIRNKRYTGDGGIDGQVIIGKYRYLIQAKRYRGHIALQHVQEFEKLLKRHNCRGLFCHTGKTGAGSKSVSIASERMEIISGQRLIDLLTPGSSFTIATAPQTMMKRTAATLETSTIVKDAGRGRLRKRKIKHAKPVAAVAMA